MQIHSKTILSSLKKIAPVMSGNRILPILNYVKITDGSIEGTNLEITVHELLDTGKVVPFVLPFDDLYRICNTINDDMTITDQKITVGKKDVFKLASPGDVQHYPVKETQSGDVFSLTADMVASLKKASTCTLDQKATNMGNVNVSISDGVLHIASTDQSQLFYEKFIVDTDIEFDVLVTVDTIKALQVLHYDCSVNDNKIFFSSPSGSISALLAEGKFPNYKPFLIQTDPENIDFNKSDLISALTKVTVYGDVSPFCDITFTPDAITFTVKNDSKEATATIELFNNIQIGTIRVNAENMLKQMRLFDDTDIVINMSLTSPHQAFMFTCVTSPMKLILMPLAPNL